MTASHRDRVCKCKCARVIMLSKRMSIFDREREREREMIIDQTYKNANWGQYCRNIFAVIRGTVNYVYLFYLHMWRTMNLYSRNSQICSIKTNLLDDKSVSHFCDYILANIDISISQFATKKFLQYWSLAGV